MLPRAYINTSEKFFIDKNLAKSYLLEIGVEGRGGLTNLQTEEVENANSKEVKDRTFYLYEIQIKLDLEDVINSKINNFKIYLTNNDNETDFVNQLYQNKVKKPTTLTSENAVAGIFNNERVELVKTLVNKNDNKKFILSKLDPKVFVDLERYKQNFRGTATDKFGLISSISSYMSKVPTDNKAKDSVTDNAMSLVSAQLKISKKIELGLLEGLPIFDVMELDKLTLSNNKKIDKSWGKNQSIRRSEEKTQFHYTDPKTREVLIPDFENAKKNRKTSIIKKKSDNQIRNVSFILKIRHKDLTKSNILEDQFGLILEAEDKNNTILDRQFVSVDLKKDIRYHLVSFENINISQGIGKNSVTLSFLGDKSTTNKNKSLEKYSMNLHHKKLKKNTAFYDADFKNTSFKREIKPNKNTILRIKSANSREESYQNESNASYEVKSFSAPMFFRFTPTIQGIDFDNFLEVGVKPLKNNYQNMFIPFLVKSISINGNYCAQLVIDTSKIPLKYKKIKIFKKDKTRALFGNFTDSLKDAHDSQGKILTSIELKENLAIDEKDKLLLVVDHNVEVNKLYEYRLEIFKDINDVGRSFSTSFFQETIEKRDNVVRFAQTTSAGRSSDSFSANISCSIIETDAEKSFKGLLGNKYDLFKSEISQIKDITTNAISVKLDRLCLTDCTIKTIDYFAVNDNNNARSEQGNTNTNNVNFTVNDSNLDKDKDYVYKLTACLKPVEELLAGINEEVQFRARGDRRSFKQFKHASIRRKIKNLNTDILYSLASKISSQKLGKIYDFETLSGLSNENIFSMSSTGDTIYIKAHSNNTASAKGPISNLVHENTITRIVKSKNKLGSKEHKNKIILEFSCDVNKEIDHAVIFLNNDGIIDYCCNMHTQKNKRYYRVLIEKENLRGKCDFYLYAINKKGKIYNPLLIDTINL